MKRTYVIDDRRYVAAGLAEQNRLGVERIHEIVGRIPDFRATVRAEGNARTASVLEVLSPNGKSIPYDDLPPLIREVTLPEILSDMIGDRLPQDRKLPLSVVEVRN